MHTNSHMCDTDDVIRDVRPKPVAGAPVWLVNYYVTDVLILHFDSLQDLSVMLVTLGLFVIFSVISLLLVVCFI
jgi:hypothetical protein